MSGVATGPLVVLLIEDNPADVVFFKEALEATRMAADVYVVGDGRTALRFLLRGNPYHEAPRPDVIVLDLNLPIRNGQEVMSDLVSDPNLNGIPVAVLTTSTSETHVCSMYPSGRCLYFTKTDDFSELQRIVTRIGAFARAGGGGAPKGSPYNG